MPNVSLIPGAATEIEPLAAVVDGYPELTHKLETTTGGAPLEDGTDVTDHAVARQDQLVLTGWVSDFSGGDRPRDAWDVVRRLQKAKIPFAVSTEWGYYPEMIIRSAEAPQTSRGMRFTLVLEEVIRVGIVSDGVSAERVRTPAIERQTQEGAVRVVEAVDTVPEAAGSAQAFARRAEAAAAEVPVPTDPVAVAEVAAAAEAVETEAASLRDHYDQFRDVLRETGALARIPGVRNLPGVGQIADLARQADRTTFAVDRLADATTVTEVLNAAPDLPIVGDIARQAIGRMRTRMRDATDTVAQVRRIAEAVQRTDVVDRGRVVLPAMT